MNTSKYIIIKLELHSFIWLLFLVLLHFRSSCKVRTARRKETKIKTEEDVHSIPTREDGVDDEGAPGGGNCWYAMV